MTVNVENIKRVFRYNNMKLEEPDTKKSPEEVKEFYATLYPELTQSVIEGPEYKGNEIIYTFTRSVGTKGGGELVINQPITLERLAKKSFAGSLENHQAKKEGKCLTQGESNQLYKILQKEGAPILPHRSSLPILP